MMVLCLLYAMYTTDKVPLCIKIGICGPYTNYINPHRIVEHVMQWGNINIPMEIVTIIQGYSFQLTIVELMQSIRIIYARSHNWSIRDYTGIPCGCVRNVEWWINIPSDVFLSEFKFLKCLEVYDADLAQWFTLSWRHKRICLQIEYR